MGVLVEGTTHQNTATRGNLDSWIASTAAPHTWTLDSVAPQETLKAIYDRDVFLLIDLATMRIVKAFYGNASAALSELDRLLAT